MGMSPIGYYIHFTYKGALQEGDLNPINYDITQYHLYNQIPELGDTTAISQMQTALNVLFSNVGIKTKNENVKKDFENIQNKIIKQAEMWCTQDYPTFILKGVQDRMENKKIKGVDFESLDIDTSDIQSKAKTLQTKIRNWSKKSITSNDIVIFQEFVNCISEGAKRISQHFGFERAENIINQIISVKSQLNILAEIIEQNGGKTNLKEDTDKYNLYKRIYLPLEETIKIGSKKLKQLTLLNTDNTENEGLLQTLNSLANKILMPNKALASNELTEDLINFGVDTILKYGKNAAAKSLQEAFNRDKLRTTKQDKTLVGLNTSFIDTRISSCKLLNYYKGKQIDLLNGKQYYGKYLSKGKVDFSIPLTNGDTTTMFNAQIKNVDLTKSSHPGTLKVISNTPLMFLLQNEVDPQDGNLLRHFLNIEMPTIYSLKSKSGKQGKEYIGRKSEKNIQNIHEMVKKVILLKALTGVGINRLGLGGTTDITTANVFIANIKGKEKNRIKIIPMRTLIEQILGPNKSHYRIDNFKTLKEIFLRPFTTEDYPEPAYMGVRNADIIKQINNVNRISVYIHLNQLLSSAVK